MSLSFENVCEIYISDGAREGLEKMVSSKCLQVKSRQSNFGRFENALKNKIILKSTITKKNELQSSCLRAETRVNKVKEKF